MLVCKHNEAVGDVSASVKANYFCLHIAIGCLKNKKQINITLKSSPTSQVQAKPYKEKFKLSEDPTMTPSFSQTLHSRGPTYLKDWIFPHMPQRALCLQDNHLLIVPGSKDNQLISTRVGFSLPWPWPDGTASH